MSKRRSKSLLSRSQRALAVPLKANLREVDFRHSHPHYVKTIELNLVPGVMPSMFEKDLGQGSGSELLGSDKGPPKFCAAYSSAALAVNCFARWKHQPRTLDLVGRTGFAAIEFEAKCPNGLPRAMPPNLDLVARSPRAVVAIESKCTEYLGRKTARFSARYESLIDDHRDGGWATAYRALKGNPKSFRFLDAAQLVKHYLGLRHTFKTGRLTLLYLYWEPQNPEDDETFKTHRDEIVAFAALVAGSSIEFRHRSYSQLWDAWSARKEPSWLAGHVRNLKQRYEVPIARE